MLFLVRMVGALGVIGVEGDPFDRLYLVVLAVGIVASVLVRFQPTGMVRVALAMAVAQTLITVVALLAGKQASPVTSVAEIVGVNAIFVVLFLGSAWLFQRAAGRRPSA